MPDTGSRTVKPGGMLSINAIMRRRAVIPHSPLGLNLPIARCESGGCGAAGSGAGAAA